MNTERAQELRTRLQAQWDGVISTLSEKIALQAVSAHGIAADHMKASAQYVAQMMQEQGIDAKVVQSTNPDGTPGAWEVIGSKIVDPEAPTVLLYAHHDVQPVPDASEWDTEPFTATIRDGRLYGRGSADDGGGIAIHRGALAILGEELGVNIRIFFEGEEEMGSPSFIPFIEEHAAEFASDVIIVADSYDTTDHNQDGYGIIPAERFYYNWTMYDFFEKNYQIDERDHLFIAVEPK